MGCHTWFGRPLTQEEYESLKPLAIKNLDHWFYEENEKLSKEYPEMDVYMTKDEYEFLKSQIQNDDIRVIADYGQDNDYLYVINGWIYVDLSDISSYPPETIRYPAIKYFHDNFRVKNYPNWIIYNKRYLKRKMGKKWYELTKEQIADIDEFWKIYPGGVIHFG